VPTFEEAEQANPGADYRAKADVWREERAAAGENAASWSAFREYVIALGAPDPGEEPFDDWVGPDFEGDTA
jgi:hypothetical protein